MRITSIRERPEYIPALLTSLEEHWPACMPWIKTHMEEVLRTGGRPLSSYRTGQVPRSDFRFKIIELTRLRAELYERINRRVEQMFNDGLPEEWKRLCANGCTADSPGMRAIGYAEFFRSDNPNEVKELIQKNSRRYAKRQITFFQKIPARRRFHPDETGEMRGFIFS